MIDLQNNLQTIQRELDAIILQIQQIASQDIVNTKNIKSNNQLGLLKDLLHILNIAADMLDTILFFPDNQ